MNGFTFRNLSFEIVEDKITLVKCGNLCVKGDSAWAYNFCEVSISGENKDTHMGAKMALSTEWNRLKYLSHQIDGDILTVVLQSPLVKAKVNFTFYDDTNAFSVFTEYENVALEPIVLEEASAFSVMGIGTVLDGDKLKFTRFTQSHHSECQPITRLFKDLGLNGGTGIGQKKISGLNVGSWSSKEELPQGLIELANGQFVMFQIESNNSWYYEISDKYKEYYLYLGGANSTYGSWMKKLNVGESYKTVTVALAFGDGLNDVISNMTAYRRHIKGVSKPDENLPTIFNEYMHLSWDNPSEENTKKYAPVAQKAGAEYYVIDCGWHDEVDTDIIYHYVGNWQESKRRFPSGVRAITDYIRSLGLKAGLWIEPEVVGFKNQELIDWYGDECFIQRNGKKVIAMNRLFLDFRHEKVRTRMTEVIRRMVEDYGAEYIKMDYNQDLGVGTDYNSFSLGEGLESSANALYGWVKEITAKFPSVVFEGCSSGGMRMDYKTLSLFPLVSTSDQVDCYKYPRIAGNILSAVVPEQAAVWSYPVGEIGGVFLTDVTKDWVDANVTEDRVALNMINSFLGRMHLASNLSLLDGVHYDLVSEGVAYFNSLTPIKKKASPYFPLGFSDMQSTTVSTGLKFEKVIYLSVYNLGGEREKTIPLCGEIQSVKVGYPKTSPSKNSFNEKELKVNFTADYQAVFVEIKLK